MPATAANWFFFTFARLSWRNAVNFTKQFEQSLEWWDVLKKNAFTKPVFLMKMHMKSGFSWIFVVLDWIKESYHLRLVNSNNPIGSSFKGVFGVFEQNQWLWNWYKHQFSAETISMKWLYNLRRCSFCLLLNTTIYLYFSTFSLMDFIFLCSIVLQDPTFSVRLVSIHFACVLLKMFFSTFNIVRIIRSIWTITRSS